MDILLVARDTMFNRIIRDKTNSLWGHSSVVIDNIIYNFDYNGSSKKSLSSIVSDSSISKATLFYADILDNMEVEDIYKELFEISDYDVKSLSNLRDKVNNGRDLENIQTSSDSYTCSSLIAKVCHKQFGKSLDLSTGIHWSQVIPDDYSKLEFKEEFIK